MGRSPAIFARPHAEETMKHETVAALLEGYLSGSTDPKITLPELLARARATVRP